jgi:hypothetical protein
MGEKGYTPYGFEYDLEFPATYEEAWDKDDAAWEQKDLEGFAAFKKEQANAKRRARRKAKKEEEEAKAKAEVT